MIGDSLLVISQTNGNWRTRDEKLIPYREHFDKLIGQFDEVTFSYLPRARNLFADALATLASMVEIPEDAELKPVVIEQRNEPAYSYQIDRDSPSDERTPSVHGHYSICRAPYLA